MPSPTTALTLIEDALGLTNAIGVDQTLTADETSDCLRVFNDILENWSLQNLAVYGQLDQVFNTVSGQPTYTIGVGGAWNTVRPVRINETAYQTIDGVLYPYATVEYLSNYPLGLITLIPTPSAVVAVTVKIDRVLSQVSVAGTSISFPPGYAKAFKYALAVELAPMFRKKIESYPHVIATQKQSLGDIKRANMTYPELKFDTALVGGYSGDWRLG